MQQRDQNQSAKRLKKTALTKLKRSPNRGHFDRQTINQILDASPICHLGHLVDGQPVVTPTFHWRQGDHVYWHGSRASRALLASQTSNVCLTVTHLDGIVLARSAFHHSANYRSAMIFGRPQIVNDPEEKIASLQTMIDGMFAGRWDTLRTASKKEINATTVLRLPIEEASAKTREGFPIDLEEDYKEAIWAGVIPLTVSTGKPIPCPANLPQVKEPENVSSYRIGQVNEAQQQ